MTDPLRENEIADQTRNYTHTFRILDLGAHDGFVSLWLARQLRERYVNLEICGLELHPGAVQIANERAEREGFTADYIQGLAEDAPLHWEYASFDAVVAFEVIEHVPSVDKFLTICESMAKRDTGMVYLSTPNGCFGTGQNPHHLRVYRDIDLFNVIRRRGEVQNFHQGMDGVSVTHYKPYAPWQRDHMKEAAVYAGPGWEKWHPSDIETKGLGGSETAAAMVADELSQIGFTVTLYGEMDDGMWRNVELRHHSRWDPMEKRDLTIVSRLPQALDRPIKSKQTIFWMHDTDYGPELTRTRAERADNIAVLSDWHRQHVETLYPWLKDGLMRVNNGINPAFFPIDKIPHERPHRAIFSSSPDRGLDFLVRIWPKVRERVPDAELVFCYSSVYDKVAQTNPALAAFRENIDQSAHPDDGFVNLGSLSQPDLAAAMATCRLWLHPSFNGMLNVPFNETFCIGAVEAAAAGCHRIMSNWGALTERLEGDYTLMPELDEDAWVDAIVRHMTDDDKMFHSFPDARNLTWRKVAQQFARTTV